MSFINKMNIGNVSYDIQAGEKVQLTFPAGTTNGTLTEEQLAKLQANYQSCIEMVNDKELYYLNDPGHVEGYLTYSHVGIENSKATIKTLTITVSAKSFVIVTTVVPTESGGGGKLYRHVVDVQPGDLYSGKLIFINQEQNSLIVNNTYIKNAQSFIRGTYIEFKPDSSLATYIVTEVGTSSSAPNTIHYLVGTTNETDESESFKSDIVTEL